MGGIGKAIGRIFTPPGTGGQEAAAQQAAANAAQAAKVQALPQAPATPPPPQPPPAQAAFSPTAVANARQRAGALTAPSILGAAATASSTQKPHLG
jgi:hypothetical protein